MSRNFLIDLNLKAPTNFTLTPFVFTTQSHLMTFLDMANNPQYIGKITLFKDGEHYYVATIHAGTVGIYSPAFKPGNYTAGERPSRRRLRTGFSLKDFPALERVYDWLEGKGYTFNGPWVWISPPEDKSGDSALEACKEWLDNNLPCHQAEILEQTKVPSMKGLAYGWMFGAWERVPGWEKAYIEA